MTEDRIKQLLRIEKIMESEACLSCGGLRREDGRELSVYEVSEIVKKGRYDRAVISAEFAVERGDSPDMIAESAVRALAHMEKEYKYGNISEIEYARCIEAAGEIINVAGSQFKYLLEEFLK